MSSGMYCDYKTLNVNLLKSYKQGDLGVDVSVGKAPNTTRALPDAGYSNKNTVDAGKKKSKSSDTGLLKKANTGNSGIK